MVDMGTLLGTVRRFGIVGPRYEVIGFADASPGVEPEMRIRLIESGEDADYAVSDILADPVED